MIEYLCHVQHDATQSMIHSLYISLPLCYHLINFLLLDVAVRSHSSWTKTCMPLLTLFSNLQ
ncbi:glutamine synthetase, chloroplastic [Iris pallida]|uniref:Glutamine synthetase, chloroplastic n=1 Tax=Iris pallida TaxID=29817 RepID=A0AAX6FXC3_IRIPA|nr:glutamine synthetase, chloroplastic [Iris pallida]